MEEENKITNESSIYEEMFIGEYEHTLDAKGRVIVPALLREQLGEKAIITKGLDKCLYIYSQKGFQIVKERMSKNSTANKRNRDFMRFFFASAFPCEFDKQGRMVIPPKLREYAELEKELCIAGVNTKVEIWDRETYAKHNAELDPNNFNSEEEDQFDIY